MSPRRRSPSLSQMNCLWWREERKKVYKAVWAEITHELQNCGKSFSAGWCWWNWITWEDENELKVDINEWLGNYWTFTPSIQINAWHSEGGFTERGFPVVFDQAVQKWVPLYFYPIMTRKSQSHSSLENQ